MWGRSSTGSSSPTAHSTTPSPTRSSTPCSEPSPHPSCFGVPDTPESALLGRQNGGWGGLGLLERGGEELALLAVVHLGAAAGGAGARGRGEVAQLGTVAQSGVQTLVHEGPRTHVRGFLLHPPHLDGVRVVVEGG